MAETKKPSVLELVGKRELTDAEKKELNDMPGVPATVKKAAGINPAELTPAQRGQKQHFFYDRSGDVPVAGYRGENDKAAAAKAAPKKDESGK